MPAAPRGAAAIGHRRRGNRQASISALRGRHLGASGERLHHGQRRGLQALRGRPGQDGFGVLLSGSQIRKGRIGGIDAGRQLGERIAGAEGCRRLAAGPLGVSASPAGRRARHGMALSRCKPNHAGPIQHFPNLSVGHTRQWPVCRFCVQRFGVRFGRRCGRVRLAVHGFDSSGVSVGMRNQGQRVRSAYSGCAKKRGGHR